MSELRDIFIRNLKFYRKQRDISQEKLSYAIDMSMNYINQLENKKSFPPPELIDKIAKVLCIRPAQLFDEYESPTNIILENKKDFIEKLTENIHLCLREDIHNGICDAIKDII